MQRFELSRGGVCARTGGSPARGEEALPNAMRLPAPSDDPAARRREMLVVLALCRAQAAGARERAAPDRALTLVHDE